MTALHEEFGKPIGRRVNLRGSVNGVTAPSTTTTTTKTTTTTTTTEEPSSSSTSTSTTTTTTTSTTTPSTTTRTTTRSTTTTTTPSTTTTTTTTTTPKPPAVTTIVEEDPEAPDPADLVGERAEHRDQVSAPPKFTPGEADPQTTETYPDSYTVVVASVHTSRSVSGARFLPSGLVNQEEKVKPLVAIQKKEDEKSSTSTTTTTTTTTTTERPKSLKSPVSTESIIDKLDRVHSELSDSVSGFSPGEDDQLELEVRKDMSAVNLTTTAATTTQSTTTTTSTTRRPSSERKFVPASRRTTPKPLKKSVFESIQFDDLTPGLLPNGFKLRTPKPRTFTTTTAAHVEKGMQSDQAQKPSPRNGAGRSTGLSIKNRIKSDSLAGLLPPGYKREQSSTTEKTLESILGKITFEDVSSLLPPGFEAPQSKPAPPKKLPVPGIKLDVPTNLLPPGYKPPSAETSSTTKKPETSTSLVESLLKNIAFKEVGSLLPPGYKQKATAKANTTDNATTTTAATTTVKAKVVLPTPTRKPLPPPRPAHKAGVNPVTPKIIKGWPVRYVNNKYISLFCDTVGKCV
ncbi:hypothetical protein AAG570_005804 [Ranatra chinensis]|uniref:Uncharacterized protein n=1 Tax=Ranatra chinensis TaxID=642074 RepID=A0ABD0YK92_9HEMI